MTWNHEEYTILAQRALWYQQRGYSIRDMQQDTIHEQFDPDLLILAWRDVAR